MQNGKKVKYNLYLGLICQILTIVMGIIIPRLVLTNFGSEINGLVNSVTQIYAYMGLLESGIGMATIQVLYKAIGASEKSQTNGILAATNRQYIKSGTLYILISVMFALVYPYVIRTEIPKSTIFAIVILNGLGGAAGFFFYRKYYLLLYVEGKTYIETLFSTLTNVLKNVAKIILIAQGADIVLVHFFSMLVSLLQAACVYWYIKKHYRWIDLSEKPNFQAISQSKNAVVHQISILIFNNTDMLILSAFCGLKVVSVYSLYAMLFGMISTALGTFKNSMEFTLGRSFHEDRQKFRKLYDMYELCYMAIVFSCYSVANYFVLPFVRCYTAGVTDAIYTDKYLPLLMIMTYLLSGGRSAPSQLITIAGHIKETQGRSILESVLNIGISVIMVLFFGVYGVLVGTVIALLYRANDMILYANHKILHCSAWPTYKRWIVNMLVFVVILGINPLISIELTSYASIFLFCIPYAAGTVVVFFCAAFLTNPSVAGEVLALLKRSGNQ